MTEEDQAQEVDLGENIEVVVEDAPPKVERAEEKKPEQAELSSDEGIIQLKKQLEQEQAARREAERLAWEANQKVAKAEKSVQDGDYQIIVSAIKQTEQNANILKQAYAQAAAAQDFAKMADVQEAMAMNANRLATLENGKVALENKLKQPVQPVSPPNSNDPVERFASSLTPRSGQWIRSHPEFVTNPAKHQKMIEGHNWAMQMGHVPDSDSYFDAVEQYVGVKPQYEPPEQEDASSMAAQVTQKRTSAPPAAPSSRVASNNSGKPTVVRLTADQKEMAQMMGMTPEEYAKNMTALKREGRLN